MPRKKKLKSAVALTYEPSKDNAPRVIAKGKGKIADKIISVAKEHGVPLHEDPSLVEVLSCLDIKEEIPVELYQVIAEILVFVYKLDRGLEKKI
ncbi:MAG TPA: EscU/YscU/HrcU family type III secretion system export apparatus switch protein [Actinobacteria bacterium]|nr:EscU/YscU/HrcU family type III secretion system export apparatus switch protein [Actinomycetota bacterium]